MINVGLCISLFDILEVGESHILPGIFIYSGWRFNQYNEDDFLKILILHKFFRIACIQAIN